MNSRAIKRKLGLDSKQIKNMIQDVHQLLDKDIFQNINKDERFITIDKNQIMKALQGQIGELEKEMNQIGQPNASSTSKSSVQKRPAIKINIS